MSEKMIRFIDTEYNTLFTVPDGGSIVITHPDGKQYIGLCKYLDDTHFDIHGSSYHIHQFATQTERSGAKAEPEKEPDMAGSYRITHRFPCGDVLYVMGHSEKAAAPYGTWQAYRHKPGKNFGRYFTEKAAAWDDLVRRANGERGGVPPKRRDEAR